MTERLKFLVADLSSETVNTLRLLGLWDMLGKEDLPMDSELMPEPFWEFDSDPDRTISRSANVEFIDRVETDLGVFGSSFLSQLGNVKHFIVLKELKHNKLRSADPDARKREKDMMKQNKDYQQNLQSQ